MASIAEMSEIFFRWVAASISLPEPILALTLAFLVVFFTSTLIFALSKHLSQKNLFTLGIWKETGKEHTLKRTAWYVVRFAAKYLVLFPIYTLMWAAMFIVFILLLTSAKDYSTVIFFATVVVAVIRATAYVNEDFSEDLAKVLPLWLLVTIMLDPNFLARTELVIDWWAFLSNELLYYGIAFIIVVEWILRLGSKVHATLSRRKDGS